MLQAVDLPTRMDFDFKQFRVGMAFARLRQKLRREVEAALRPIQYDTKSGEDIAPLCEQAAALVRVICHRDSIPLPEEFVDTLASGIVLDILSPEHAFDADKFSERFNRGDENS